MTHRLGRSDGLITSVGPGPGWCAAPAVLPELRRRALRSGNRV